MAAETIKTERLILRDIKKNDVKNLKYLLKPEIETYSGPYMPHNKNNFYNTLTESKETPLGELLLMMVHLLEI